MAYFISFLVGVLVGFFGLLPIVAKSNDNQNKEEVE